MKLYVEMSDSEYSNFKQFLSDKDKQKATDYSIGELAAALLSKIKNAGGEVHSERLNPVNMFNFSGSLSDKIITRTVAQIDADGYKISLGVDSFDKD